MCVIFASLMDFIQAYRCTSNGMHQWLIAEYSKTPIFRLIRHVFRYNQNKLAQNKNNFIQLQFEFIQTNQYKS